MPVDTIGFRLEPDGFFDRNPSLDVPPSATDHCAPGSGHDHDHAAHDHAAHDHHADAAHDGHVHAEQQHDHEGGR